MRIERTGRLDRVDARPRNIEGDQVGWIGSIVFVGIQDRLAQGTGARVIACS